MVARMQNQISDCGMQVRDSTVVLYSSTVKSQHFDVVVVVVEICLKTEMLLLWRFISKLRCRHVRTKKGIKILYPELVGVCAPDVAGVPRAADKDGRVGGQDGHGEVQH